MGEGADGYPYRYGRFLTVAEVEKAVTVARLAGADAQVDADHLAVRVGTGYWRYWDHLAETIAAGRWRT